MKKGILYILLFLAIALFACPAMALASDETEVNRYTVLVLDASNSMEGKPLEEMKTAAINFCSSVLQSTGNNYVAVVSYNNTATINTRFSDNFDTLSKEIGNIKTGVFTNILAGLKEADGLLTYNAPTGNIVKNIVLLSDGLPTAGETLSTGRYAITDNAHYAYANSLYSFATTVRGKGINITSLCFFHNIDAMYGIRDNSLPSGFAQKIMLDIVGGKKDYCYEVKDAAGLEFAFGNIAGEIITEKTGKYEPDNDTYYYFEDYFNDSSFATRNSIGYFEYNDSLATMSLCLALSASNSTRAKALLKEIGFKNIQANYDLLTNPGRDTIGAVAAKKLIKVNNNEHYTLIALAIRGTSYGAEWAGNFKVGKTGQHEGFDEAKNKAFTFLKEYIAENDISGNIKIWLTGFSRGGATANLLAGELDDLASQSGGIISLPGKNNTSCRLLPKDLYTYCFEAPMGSLREYAKDISKGSRYNNIINIINPLDVVTKVAPSTFGFARYGIDIILPTATNSSNFSLLKNNMLSQYNTLTSIRKDGAQYTLDNFVNKKLVWEVGWWLIFPYPKPVIVDGKKVSMDAYLDTLIRDISVQIIRSRSNYVDRFQNDIREIMGLNQEADSKQTQVFSDHLSASLFNASNIPRLALALINPFDSVFEELFDLVSECVYDSLRVAGMASTYSTAQIEKMIKSLTSVLLSLVVFNTDSTVTLFSNSDIIGAAHEPSICLAWMQSRDINYTTNAFWTRVIGSYRIIRINCPVDVKVFLNNKLVAAIIDDEPQEIVDSAIIATINEDGEKIVYLPADADYEVVLKATDNGEMTFSINEFCFETNDVSKIINYYSLPLSNNMEFEAIFPAFKQTDIKNGIEEGSSIQYSLLHNGARIKPNIELTGTDAAEAYHMVEVSTEYEDYGLVMGSGIRQLGSFAMVTAIPTEGYEFIGWYKNDAVISTEAVYRFCVMEDISLVAKFIKLTEDTGSRPLIGEFKNFKDNIPKDYYKLAKNANGQQVISYSVNKDWYCLIADISGYTSDYTRLCMTLAFNGTKELGIDAVIPGKKNWVTIRDAGLSFNKQATQNADGSYTFDIPLAKYADIKSNGLSSIVFYMDPTVTFSGTRSFTVIDIGLRKEGEPAGPLNTQNSIFPTNIELQPDIVSLNINSTQQLAPTIWPSNATDKSITWASSKTEVATVSASGLVTAKAVGSATITATTANGLAAICEVTVINGNTSDNMAYFLKFNGNLNNENGAYPQVNSVVGSPSYVSGRNGNKAISLNYRNYLKLDKTNDLIDYNQSFTIAYWIKINSTAGNDPAIMSNKNWTSGGNNGWMFTAKNGIIKLNSKSRSDSSRVNGSTDIEITKYVTGQWVHIAAVWDKAANKVRTYANGVLTNDLKTNLATGMGGNGAPTLIGQSNDSSSSNLYNSSSMNVDFVIQDFFMTNRALTTEEISANFFDEPIPGIKIVSVSSDPSAGTSNERYTYIVTTNVPATKVEYKFDTDNTTYYLNANGSNNFDDGSPSVSADKMTWKWQNDSLWGTYNHTVTVKAYDANGNVDTATFNIMVSEANRYNISLNPDELYTFPNADEGYGPQTAKTVTATNTGSAATGSLNVALSGADRNSFTLSGTSLNSISAGSARTFTVTPKTGLKEGTYTATVTVSNTNVAATFDVSFTVTKAEDDPPVLDRPLIGEFKNHKDNNPKNFFTITNNPLNQQIFSYTKKPTWDNCLVAEVSGYAPEYTRLCVTATFTGSKQFTIEIPGKKDTTNILWSEFEKSSIMTKNSDNSYTFDIPLTMYKDIQENGISSIMIFLDPEASVSGTRSMTLLDIGFRKDGEAAW
ncbi:MAG: Ig-like domain-containing protein [Firmicutes bacterium]|nr:Ig-like domain-containing protein [Bacillota bacterium]